MTGECIHELPQGTCDYCLHPFVPEKIVSKMYAKYGGRCPECNEEIEVGDLIAHMMPNDKWLHNECAP